MSDLERRNTKWEKNFDQIEKDYDNLVIWWKKNKKCSCDSEEDGIYCKHYEKLLHQTLGDRIDKSFDERLSIGFATLDTVTKDERP